MWTWPQLVLTCLCKTKGIQAVLCLPGSLDPGGSLLLTEASETRTSDWLSLAWRIYELQRRKFQLLILWATWSGLWKSGGSTADHQENCYITSPATLGAVCLVRKAIFLLNFTFSTK